MTAAPGGFPPHPPPPDAADPPVVVVGGGLAGITAALHLADRGHRVVLFEARPHLGGATYSFTRGELTVDTGQHVFLRCYTRYRALLDRLGVAGDAPVQERFSVPVLHRPRPGGPFAVAWLRRGRLGPAPLHLAGSLLTYAPLPPADRVRVATAALALRTVDPDDPAADTVAFGDWLRAHGQSPTAVARLWALLTVPALNLHPDAASLALAARVFRTALLDHPPNADIGVPEVPLRQLHADPALRLLTRLGVRVETKTRVEAVEPVGGGFAVRTPTDEMTARAVVVAVPHAVAARITPVRAVPERDRWARLGASPIVNVHLRYDRPVTTLRFAAGLDTPVQWVFDRTRAAGLDRGQYLTLSLSAAHDDRDRTAEELRTRYASAVAELFPQARDATLVEAFVTREPHATFRQSPGTAALRPAATTALPGLVLAGAWTRTGWPDTMEGAVASGLHAADAIDRHTPTPGRSPGRVPTEAN